MHRLALVTAYEALDMSGYSSSRTPSTNKKRIGTYHGQASDDWRELNGGQNIGTYAVPGGERAFANGGINYLGTSSNFPALVSTLILLALAGWPLFRLPALLSGQARLTLS